MNCKFTGLNRRCKTMNSCRPKRTLGVFREVCQPLRFCPIGYFVWDDQAMIFEVKLSGDTRLGLDEASQSGRSEFDAMGESMQSIAE